MGCRAPPDSRCPRSSSALALGARQLLLEAPISNPTMPFAPCGPGQVDTAHFAPSVCWQDAGETENGSRGGPAYSLSTVQR